MWLRESMSESSKQVELANTTSPSDQSKSRKEPCTVLYKKGVVVNGRAN